MSHCNCQVLFVTASSDIDIDNNNISIIIVTHRATLMSWETFQFALMQIHPRQEKGEPCEPSALSGCLRANKVITEQVRTFAEMKLSLLLAHR